MPTQPTVTDVRRVIALEHAANWLNSAVRALRAGDVPGAVFDCRAGSEHAQDALDELILMLHSGEDSLPRFDSMVGMTDTTIPAVELRRGWLPS